MHTPSLFHHNELSLSITMNQFKGERRIVSQHCLQSFVSATGKPCSVKACIESVNLIMQWQVPVVVPAWAGLSGRSDEYCVFLSNLLIIRHCMQHIQLI